MPRCVIINCNSPKISNTQRQERISYHSFPHDPIIKEKWIAATGRKDWFPTKHSTICSIHFDNTSFIEGTKLRLLKKTACPTIDILKLIDNQDENKDTPQKPSSLSRKRKLEMCPDEDPLQSDSEASVSIVIKQEIEDEISEHEDDLTEKLTMKRQREEEAALATNKKIKEEVTVVVPIETESQTPHTSQATDTDMSAGQLAKGAKKQSFRDKEISEVFMSRVLNSQDEILSILKNHVLLQNPDQDLLKFLRFLGMKLQRISKGRRKELQNKITEMVLREE